VSLKSAVVVEALEGRTLLAALTPHTYTLTLYRDNNFNKVQDKSERGSSGLAVRATVTDAGGATRIVHELTDAAGRATFTSYVAAGDVGKVRFRVPVHARFRSTTSRTDSLPAWFVDAYLAKPTAAIGLTDRTPLTGSVQDYVSFRDGFHDTTPLALRRVYDDLNNDGKFEHGEPSTLSGLDGRYTITLRSGLHTLRLQKRTGWGTAPGVPGAMTMSTLPTTKALPTFVARMSRPVIVDVLAAYTTATADGRGPSTMTNYVRNLFVLANRPYANSDTNVLINLKRVYRATGYEEQGDLSDDLDAIQNDSDGKLDEIYAQRKSAKADLTTLITSDDKNTGDSIGIAYEFDKTDTHAEFAFSVVAVRGDDEDDAVTLAHELGHNLGAGHDAKADDGDLSNSDAPAKYANGYIFKGDNGRTYRDVMSYGSSTIIPFFSTPRFTYQGVPIGNATNADNARIIRELAPEVSAYT
jgi:hypothetical protein